MYSLWNFFLERRAFTTLSMISLLALGVYAIIMMPKEASPEVTIPRAIVSTALPGATATDIERLVIDKLEPSVRTVANVDKVTSVAQQGLGVITVEFTQDVDLNTAVQDVRNAVDRSRGDLPDEATAPVVTKVDTSDQPILIVSVSSDLAPETLASLGDDLKDTLTQVSGVSKVEVSGVRQREIGVVIRKDALQRNNVGINQVIRAIQAANASAPVGTITMDGVEYAVQFKGDVTDADQIRSVPISTPTGKILVSDVATVIDGFQKESSISYLSVDGSVPTYALTLNIYKSKGGSILTVSKDVKAKLDSLHSSLLQGSHAAITYDGAKEVRTNISDLTGAGRDTIILVMLVLFLSIGFLEAFVSALSIPFSFMIAFILMWMTGNTINFLSLFSLIIAIGILVDSGIVVVEAIHTNREKGMEKTEAARAAIHQYAWPLIAGTMTTVAVFAPLFFLSGIIGEYMKSIPFTVIVVLLASILVALGFVPTLAIWLLRHDESRLGQYREHLWVVISEWYRGKLAMLFASRRLQRLFLAFLGVTFVVAMALPVTGVLKVSMFPSADQDFFYISIELPQASTLLETDALAREVEQVVAKLPAVASYTTTIGATSAFGGFDGSSSNSKYANITVNLVDDRDSDHSSIKVAALAREELRAIHSAAKISVVENSGGPPSGAPVVVKVWGEDPINLAKATSLVQGVVEKSKGTRDVSSSLDADSTQLSVNIDRKRANDYGLSAADIAGILQASVSGMKATTLKLDGKDVEVRVRLALNEQYVDPGDATIADVDALMRIPVTTARGTVPLSSFVSVAAERSATQISHEDGDRLNTVSAYLVDGTNAVDVTGSIQSALESAPLPEGTRVTFGGDTEDINKTFTEMIVALVAGIVFMFMILVLEFDAFRTSGRLLLAIPLSLTGVLIGLTVFNQPLSITAMLGIIALGGVLINHGILLLDVLNTVRSSDQSMSPEEVVLTAASTRIRPILLTTITTVIGMIPLVFVSAMWAPLAYTIAFGLIYGTLLTLIFIPLLSYRYEVKVRARLAREQAAQQ